MNRHEMRLIDGLGHKASRNPLFLEVYKLLDNGWNIVVDRLNRGTCYYRTKLITIPVWAVDKLDVDYAYWYLAHEVSHAIAGREAAHGPEFMAVLVRICPKECIHYELTYKPRNAMQAGIMPSDF